MSKQQDAGSIIVRAPFLRESPGPRTADRPMWCDDFDMDLPKVLPDARALFGDLAEVELQTYCNHPTFGALNHPVVWNHDDGLVAYFGFRSPRKPEACWTSAGIIRCSVWEAVRDAWAHHFVMVVEGRRVLDANGLWRPFETIMWGVRGWGNPRPAAVKSAKARSMATLERCAATLRAVQAEASEGNRKDGSSPKISTDHPDETEASKTATPPNPSEDPKP